MYDFSFLAFSFIMTLGMSPQKMEPKPREFTVRNHKPELSLSIAMNHMLNPCHAKL